jgi:hypothetical protein
VKSSYCIFAVRPKIFHFSSLKEIENQVKTYKKVLAENNMARTFALPKNGRLSKLRKAMDCHPEQSEGKPKDL